MEYTRCPRCGERLFKDKFCNMGLVYAERIRCIKCGFWETRELPIPQPIKRKTSVLIKDMEMPTSCEKCPFLDYEEGFCFASGVKHESGWYESTLCPGGIKDGRHDDCPLVPVPPHGRLIDADELAELCDIMADKCGGIGESIWGQFRATVEWLPTIIEAEE